MGDKVGAGLGPDVDAEAGTGASSLRVSGAGFTTSFAGSTGSGGGLDGWLFSILGGADAGLASGSTADGAAAVFTGVEAFPQAIGEYPGTVMI